MSIDKGASRNKLDIMPPDACFLARRASGDICDHISRTLNNAREQADKAECRVYPLTRPKGKKDGRMAEKVQVG
ncbi:MAG TPA: hypothetical protein VGM23_18425, partial [Armatimonadota bacterium]